MSLSFCAIYCTLSQRNHIALQIVGIEVVNIIIGDHAGLALRIVETVPYLFILLFILDRNASIKI